MISSQQPSKSTPYELGIGMKKESGRFSGATAYACWLFASVPQTQYQRDLMCNENDREVHREAERRPRNRNLHEDLLPNSNSHEGWLLFKIYLFVWKKSNKD